MEERKIKDRYIDESLGFPVELRDVPMKKVRGEWVLDLPLGEYQQVVLWMLAHHEGRLSGRQVRFVRHWMEMTQKEFSELLGVSHVAVSKWERAGAEATKMGKAIEVVLRMEILKALPEQIWDKMITEDGTKTRKQSFSELHDRLKSAVGHDAADQVIISPEELSTSGRLRLG